MVEILRCLLAHYSGLWICHVVHYMEAALFGIADNTALLSLYICFSVVARWCEAIYFLPHFTRRRRQFSQALDLPPTPTMINAQRRATNLGLKALSGDLVLLE
jgi:hypothetical protein